MTAALNCGILKSEKSSSGDVDRSCSQTNATPVATPISTSETMALESQPKRCPLAPANSKVTSVATSSE